MKHNKKKLSISLLILFLILLSSCSKSKPIIAYDMDLDEKIRESIVKEYDRQLKLQEELKQKNQEDSTNDEIINSTINDSNDYVNVDSSINSDYIDFEDRDEILNDTIITSNNDLNNDFPVVILFKNQPDFDLSLYKTEAFEHYSDLDALGRVGKAEAMIGKETMPTTGRESIGMIKPTGWQTVKYDNIDGKYLYNRCHLIGWQLSAENKNEKNLFTGTRYLNVKGMLPFENQVANYIKTTGNHVLYRVTPIFEGENLVANVVQMEAKSVEDNGKGICFNIYAYNVQPGITINYANGDSYKTK